MATSHSSSATRFSSSSASGAASTQRATRRRWRKKPRVRAQDARSILHAHQHDRHLRQVVDVAKDIKQVGAAQRVVHLVDENRPRVHRQVLDDSIETGVAAACLGETQLAQELAEHRRDRPGGAGPKHRRLGAQLSVGERRRLACSGRAVEERHALLARAAGRQGFERPDQRGDVGGFDNLLAHRMFRCCYVVAALCGDPYFRGRTRPRRPPPLVLPFSARMFARKHPS